MMKLVMAIVSSDNSRRILDALSEQGFTTTVNSSTGGYSRNSSTTIYCGVDESEVESVLSAIRDGSSSDSSSDNNAGGLPLPSAKSGLATSVSAPAKMSGRTTIFVLDVHHFEQI